MRTLTFCLLLLPLAYAEDKKDKPEEAKAKPVKVEAVSEEQAKAALDEFDKAFKKIRDVEGRQHLIYNLHDVPHDLVIKRLEKLLRNKSPELRNVAALALGGQGHNAKKAGEVLIRGYDKQFKEEMVVIAILESMTELSYMGYWPKVEKAMSDERNAIVIRVLGLLGDNQDWRALPKLLKMFEIALPRRVSWSTGTVTVDTGAAGDVDQKAAEAKFNKKYGAGGSKMRAKAAAKAKAFDERNFSTQLRKAVKKITGEDFDNAIDFEDWYVDNYVKVQRKIAELSGADVGAAERKAKAELPALKTEIEEKRKKQEEDLKKQQEKDK